MNTLIARLKHPEDHYEITDPKKANAVLMSLCQEAADALAAPVQEPVAWQDELALIEAVLKGYPNSIAKADALRAVRVLQATTPAAPVQCEWCNGRGVLAGHAQDGSFDGEDCPHCTPPAQPAPVPLTLWTEAQHERAYRNSPELHKDVKSLAAFKRVAKEVAAMYGITKGQS
jgi:hypothetical protein